MTTLAQRDANGIVTAQHGDASIQIKVPRDRSMLSILGSPTAGEICTGYEYREDGYVYLEGNRIKKWFITIGDCSRIQVWEPSLEDIPILEARYWRVRQAAEDWWRDCHQELVKKIYDAGGKAHAETPSIQRAVKWCLYRVTYQKLYGLCVGFIWCDVVPETPINLDLGQEYWQVDCYSNSISRRREKFSQAMKRAIDLYLAKRLPDKPDVILKLKINSRDYFYRSEISRGGLLTWKKLVWPPDAVVEIVL